MQNVCCGNCHLSILSSHFVIAVATDDTHPLNHPFKNKEGTSLAVVAEEMLKDVPCLDDDADTRIPHAFAGQIKHSNRSRWRYTNIQSHPGCCYGRLDDGGELAQPWRRFPGE
jgi:hypothetical protein